jgi:hypothetical protein
MKKKKDKYVFFNEQRHNLGLLSKIPKQISIKRGEFFNRPRGKKLRIFVRDLGLIRDRKSNRD